MKKFTGEGRKGLHVPHYEKERERRETVKLIATGIILEGNDCKSGLCRKKKIGGICFADKRYKAT